MLRSLYYFIASFTEIKIIEQNMNQIIRYGLLIPWVQLNLKLSEISKYIIRLEISNFWSGLGWLRINVKLFVDDGW